MTFADRITHRHKAPRILWGALDHRRGRNVLVGGLLCLLVATLNGATNFSNEPIASVRAQENQPRVVRIRQQQFEPASVTVAPGQTVRWVNEDDRDHRIVATDKSFDSGNLKPGARFDQRFARAGTFDYSNAYRPRMKGTVVVK